MTAGVNDYGKRTEPRLVLALRYRDVDAAAAWLCDAFGFERQSEVAVGGGGAEIARVTFANAMVMILPVGSSDLDRHMKQPDEIGGAETQSCYLVVDDVDQHHARAKAAGAEIILDIQRFDQGGRGYSCRDLEGHIWSFGTFDPWQAKAVPQPQSIPTLTVAGSQERGPVAYAFAGIAAAASVVVMIVALLLWPGSPLGHIETGALPAPAVTEVINAERAVQDAQDEVARARAEREAAERRIGELERKLAAEKVARQAAEASRPQAKTQVKGEAPAEPPDSQVPLGIARERKARQAAEWNAEEAQKLLARERALRESAEEDIRTIEAKLLIEEEARARAELAERRAAELLDKERQAREGAERAAAEARAALAQAVRAAEDARAPLAASPTRSKPPSPRTSSESGDDPMPAVIP